MQKTETGPLSYSTDKNQVKMHKILNLRHETKITWKKIYEVNYLTLVFAMFFFLIWHLTKASEQKEQTAKANAQKINRRYYMKLKMFFWTEKKTSEKIKRQPMKWKKTLAKHISNKELIYKRYKEVIGLKSKQKNLILKWAEELEIFFKRIFK